MCTLSSLLGVGYVVFEDIRKFWLDPSPEDATSDPVLSPVVFGVWTSFEGCQRMG